MLKIIDLCELLERSVNAVDSLTMGFLGPVGLELEPEGVVVDVSGELVANIIGNKFSEMRFGFVHVLLYYNISI